MTDMKKQLRGIITIGVIFLSIILINIASSYMTKLEAKLFEERKLHLIEFTEKVSEIMEETVLAAWNEVSICEYILNEDREAIETKDELVKKMAELDTFDNAEYTILLAFDENGEYYSSDGKKGYWEESSLLHEADENGIQAIAQIPHKKGENYLLFMKKMEEKEHKKGIKITHVALAIHSESMQRQFSISGFGKECYSYIINNTGRRLYQYTYENNFVESYNIFNAIESYPVVNGGDFQTLREAVKEDESTAIEFLYTDETTGEEREWFVANASIQESDWSVLLFVPADVLGASTNDLLNETLRSFVILSIIIIAIFILMMFVIIAGRADRKILREKEAANAKLEETVQRANDANAAKSEFLSRMSHDIRTPINAIIGMTGIALKHIDDKERVRDCLLKIDGSSQHLFSLINDVLDMSRIESGRTTMVKVAFNLSACVENCASIIEGQLATRDIELVREFEKMDNPYVLGDELHLHQVFINILGNAVKFTPDGGKIFFREKQIDIDGATGFRFEIEDTGIGMKEEYLPHLFEAFSQEDDGSRTTYKGTGLGMAIVKQFVEMMGGTVEVESALNIGTKVTIDMPMEIAEDSPEEEKYCRVRFDLRGMKVLLVDDNELNLEIAQELLEEQGIIVTTAEDGQEAIDVFKQSKLGDFDVILMDVMMPVMDGLVATKTIRAMKREDATKIPIIAMTANAYNEDVIKTAEAGMNAHLLKPIDVSKLYVTLASYYRGGGKVT